MTTFFGTPIPQHRVYPVGIVHNFYIYGEICELEEYVDMITILDTATENDIINIFLNTVGGEVYTAISIIHAMMRTNGNVIVHADGLVASAGTLLFFAAPTRAINRYSTFMFHDASTGMAGKLNENAKSLHSLSELIQQMSYELMTPYFSDEEIQDILEGRDYYCNSEQMIERLQAGEDIVEKTMEEVLSNMEKEKVDKAQESKPKRKSKVKE